MSRTKKFIKNSMSTGILQIVTFTLGLITSRIMLSCYGSEINGLVSSINQLITYANLVEAGLSGAAIYALYAPLANENKREINDIVAATNKYYIQTGAIFSTIVLALAILYPQIVNVTVLSKWQTSILVAVLGLSGAISFFISAKYRALFTADQKQYILSYSTILAVILNTLLVIIFGKGLRINITLLRFFVAMTSVVPVFVYLIYTKKNYPYIDLKNAGEYKLKSRYTVFINEIFGSIHFGSPIIIITALCSLLEVSVFSVYKVVFSGINSICNALILPMSASFGETLSIKDRRPFKRGYSEFEMMYYAVSTVIYSCAGVLILSFVSIYTSGVTDINYLQPSMALLFTIDATIANLYGPQAVLVRAGGLFKEVRTQTILQACITIVLGIILTKSIGMQGMLVASAISNTIRVVLIIRLIHNQNYGVSIKQTIKRIFVSIVAMIIIILPFVFGNCLRAFSFLQIHASNYLQWALCAIQVTLYAIIVCFIAFYLTDKNTLVQFGKRIVSVIFGKKEKQNE